MTDYREDNMTIRQQFEIHYGKSVDDITNPNELLDYWKEHSKYVTIKYNEQKVELSTKDQEAEKWKGRLLNFMHYLEVENPELFMSKGTDTDYIRLASLMTKRIKLLEGLLEDTTKRIDECFLPENVTCDGTYCPKCWKDVLISLREEINKAL